MKKYLYKLVALFAIILFAGCTTPTINHSMKHTWLKDKNFNKVNSVTVIVVPMDEWSVHGDDLSNLEKIREGIVDEFDDIGIKNGRDLTIKILVRHYLSHSSLARALAGFSPGNVSARIEYYDFDDNIISKAEILVKNDVSIMDMNMKKESEVDGFIREVVKNANIYLRSEK